MTVATLQQEQEQVFLAARQRETSPEAVGLKDALWKAGKLLKKQRPEKALELLARAAESIPPEATGADVHIFLIRAWALTGAFYALMEGLLPLSPKAAELGVSHFLAAVRHARGVGLSHVADDLIKLITSENGSRYMSDEEKDAFQGLEVMIRLGEIQDPFQGWQALAMEISKVWPKGVSAVDAIREQRR